MRVLHVLWNIDISITARFNTEEDLHTELHRFHDEWTRAAVYEYLVQECVMTIYTRSSVKNPSSNSPFNVGRKRGKSLRKKDESSKKPNKKIGKKKAAAASCPDCNRMISLTCTKTGDDDKITKIKKYFNDLFKANSYENSPGLEQGLTGVRLSQDLLGTPIGHSCHEIGKKVAKGVPVHVLSLLGRVLQEKKPKCTKFGTLITDFVTKAYHVTLSAVPYAAPPTHGEPPLPLLPPGGGDGRDVQYL